MLVLGAAGVAVSAAGATSARAAASTVDVNLTETTISQSTPAAQWVDGGILHLRGRTDVLAVTGDLQGMLTATLNVDLDLSSGNGQFSGTLTLATPGVTWSGAARGTIDHGLANGSYVGRGEDGSEIHGVFTQTDANTFADHAEILAP